MLAAPAAWTCDLAIRYALVKRTCASHHTFVLQLVSLAALAVIGGAAITAWRAYRQTPPDAPTDGGRPVDRSRFMAMLGLMTSGLFAVAVLAGAFPQWVLDACQ
jgi:hypothetical protein